VAAAARRQQSLARGELKPLPAPAEAAADRSYENTATKVCNGLEAVLKSYESSFDAHQAAVHRAWIRAQSRIGSPALGE
jgi:hypothetical protein